MSSSYNLDQDAVLYNSARDMWCFFYKKNLTCCFMQIFLVKEVQGQGGDPWSV